LALGKRITLALLALPLAELAVFVAVAVAVGIATALALMILTTFVGALVLRHVGRTGLTQVRGAIADPAAAREAGGGLLLGLGGILLVLPGFITDAVGALLLLPAVRRGLGATIRRWTFGQGEPQRPDVVDLAPNEWLEVGEPKLPPSEPRTDRS
jgi:UPF0716 protein FxsA